MRLPDTIAGLRVPGASLFADRVTAIDTSVSPDRVTLAGGGKSMMVDNGGSLTEGDLVVVLTVGNRSVAFPVRDS